jgi:dTDP-glucose 4,6-dehydratase
MTRVLITGIAGFSGSHLAERVLDTTDWEVIGLDCLTYAGRLQNLAQLDTSRIQMIYQDFSHTLDTDTLIHKLGDIDYIVHLGAETHVANSLKDPSRFVASNIMGTFNLLEAAKWLKPKKFLFVSTDEVFGGGLVPRTETDPLNPSNPYAATKAAAEYLVRAFGRTYDIPWIITRTSNIYGNRQHKEKFVPLIMDKIERNETIEIHADKEGVIGSRQWVFAPDQARALIFLLKNPTVNEIYHIAGERKNNLEVVRQVNRNYTNIKIVNAFDKYHGHDLHYALDDSKLRALMGKAATA